MVAYGNTRVPHICMHEGEGVWIYVPSIQSPIDSQSYILCTGNYYFIILVPLNQSIMIIHSALTLYMDLLGLLLLSDRILCCCWPELLHYIYDSESITTIIIGIFSIHNNRIMRGQYKNMVYTIIILIIISVPSLWWSIVPIRLQLHCMLLSAV